MDVHGEVHLRQFLLANSGTYPQQPEISESKVPGYFKALITSEGPLGLYTKWWRRRESNYNGNYLNI